MTGFTNRDVENNFGFGPEPEVPKHHHTGDDSHWHANPTDLGVAYPEDHIKGIQGPRGFHAPRHHAPQPHHRGVG